MIFDDFLDLWLPFGFRTWFTLGSFGSLLASFGFLLVVPFGW
jgi:hypothetical protein